MSLDQGHASSENFDLCYWCKPHAYHPNHIRIASLIYEFLKGLGLGLTLAIYYSFRFISGRHVACRNYV